MAIKQAPGQIRAAARRGIIGELTNELLENTVEKFLKPV